MIPGTSYHKDLMVIQSTKEILRWLSLFSLMNDEDNRLGPLNDLRVYDLKRQKCLRSPSQV